MSSTAKLPPCRCDTCGREEPPGTWWPKPGDLCNCRKGRYRAILPTPSAGDPEVRRTLVLSTQHLHGDDAARLNNGEVADPSAGETDPAFGRSFVSVPYGWMTRAADFVDSEDGNGDEECDLWSTDMEAVCRYALAHGCSHILFDRDADTVDGLATHEW